MTPTPAAPQPEKPTPVGPEPASQGAAFNPYVPSSKHEVLANPATISHPSSSKRSTGSGANLGSRVVGSERIFNGLAYSFELLKGILVLIILAVMTHLFVATVFRISGESMLPSFVDGQFILVDKVSYLFDAPVRGDVVVIQFPGDPENRKFIKRVIGLPGEKVEVRNGKFLVDDQELLEPYLPANLLTSPELMKILRGDEYFVVGDNRPNSNDSRFFGPVPIDKFIGKSQAILSGSAFGWVAQPAY